ncbi:hypothetical protein TSMEX_011762, partial [Taenia solium]
VDAVGDLFVREQTMRATIGGDLGGWIGGEWREVGGIDSLTWHAVWADDVATQGEG